MFVAVIKMSDSGDVIKVDQEHLETVIPALGNVRTSYVKNNSMSATFKDEASLENL